MGHMEEELVRTGLCLHGFQDILQTHVLLMPFFFFFGTEFQNNLHSFCEAVIYTFAIQIQIFIY